MKYKRIKFRRRRESKTDYKARLVLLRSGLPRIVVRKTNKCIIAQVVVSKGAQDFIKLAAVSSELKGYGWPSPQYGSLKSVPAAYLTGVLLADRIKFSKSGINDAILDIGLSRSTKGSRLYAVAKGLADGGVRVRCSQDMFPSQERIEGKHMKNKVNITEIRSKIK